MKNKHDKVRYEKRDQIEELIKSKKIDRNKFHEVSKLDWDKIIKRLHYTFYDHQKSQNTYMWKGSQQKDWCCQTNGRNDYGWTPYMWLRFRKDLIVADRIREDDWGEYIENIFNIVPEWDDKTFYYLITDGGWVYEGTLLTIVNILRDYPIDNEEFYLFPKDYSWVITHSDDAECMWRTVCGNFNLCE